MTSKSYTLETLEPRILLSADAFGADVTGDVENTDDSVYHLDSLNPVVLDDDDGTQVSFSLRGPGTGEVELSKEGFDLRLENTDL